MPYEHSIEKKKLKKMKQMSLFVVDKSIQLRVTVLEIYTLN